MTLGPAAVPAQHLYVSQFGHEIFRAHPFFFPCI
jgi:hypothetical protein